VITEGTLDARGRRLRAALGFLQLTPRALELRLLHRWLDTWAGIGFVVVCMARQSYDLQITAYGDHDWRANFFPVARSTLREHDPDGDATYAQ
jgi:hypothetical protein